MEIIKVKSDNSYYKFFEDKLEAQNMIDFLNSKIPGGDNSPGIKFALKEIDSSAVEKIQSMNKLLDTPLVEAKEGMFYVVAGEAIPNTGGAFDFKTVSIFKNNNNDLVFSETLANKLTKKTAMVDDLKISEFNIPKFVMPNPFSQNLTIQNLDGNKKIANHVLTKNNFGVTELMRADYPRVLKDISNFVIDEIITARGKMNSSGIDYLEQAKMSASRSITSISGKTTTDTSVLGLIKGTEGLNLNSSHNYNASTYTLNKDDYLQLFDKGREYISDKEKLKADELNDIFKDNEFLKIKFDEKNNIIESTILSKEGNREIDPNSWMIKDINSRARFYEVYKNKMSVINNGAIPLENARHNIVALNTILDDYYNGTKNMRDTLKDITDTIRNSYDGHNNIKVDSLLSDDGILSRKNLISFIQNKNKFHAFLDVNRQSINTEDAVTMMSGAIFDVFGSFNKIGQRNAQADAKMSKAIIRVGDNKKFDLSKEAIKWSSEIDELKYKKINFENGHAKELITKAQEILYDEELNSSYFGQQNYMLYGYHNAAFQDSNLIATDLAMENISKYDNKNTLFIPYNSMTNAVIDGMEINDLNNLKNENAYVDGTIENKMFRTLLGEENYKKHLISRETLVADYQKIGQVYKDIQNLQSIDNRKLYAQANNEALGMYNEFLYKHMLPANSKAKVDIINPIAVKPGQFKNITGVNFAYIDGVDFTEQGVRINTSGIITQGDSVKFMVNEVKSTTQGIMPSIGLITDNGYLQLSGVNNEKMMSGKRGFTGTLLERSLNTLAFNYMTYGNSESYEENFNKWKEIMSNQYLITGKDDKQLNIFEALNIDMDFQNGIMRFTNKTTNRALADFDFRTNGLEFSVNKGIHQYLSEHVEKNFGFKIDTETQNDFIEPILTSLAEAEEGLKETITGNKWSLNEAQRKNMMGIFVRGNLETINISKGRSIVSDLGKVHGLRLINNVHIMQETKSRADKEGLSIGRLSSIVLRESGMETLADLIDEKIVYDNAEKLEKYAALTGALDSYGNINDLNSKSYKLFSKNIVNLNDKDIRYNLFGLNNTLDSYINLSPFGEFIDKSINTETGKLDKSIYGKIVGFNDQFLEVIDDITGENRNQYLENVLKSFISKDLAEYISDGKYDKKHKIISNLKEIINKNYSQYINNSSFGVIKLLNGKEFDPTMYNSFKFKNAIIANAVKSLGKDNSDGLLNNIFKENYSRNSFNDFVKLTREYNSISFESNLLKKDRLNYLKEKTELESNIITSYLNYIESDYDFMNSFTKGERAFRSNEFIEDLPYKNIELSINDKYKAKKILNLLTDELENNNNYNSLNSISSIMIERYNDFSGRNIYNLKELQKISQTNNFNFLIDTLETDQFGQIISNNSLKELENLIKLNQDLNSLDSKINKFKVKNKETLVFDNFKDNIKDVIKSYTKENSKGIDVKKYTDNIYSIINSISGEKIVDDDFIDLLSPEDKISLVHATNQASNYKSFMNLSHSEATEKYKKSLDLQKKAIEKLKESINERFQNSIRLPNSTVDLARNNSDFTSVKGSILNEFIDLLNTDDITFLDLKEKIETIQNTLNLTKGSNIYKNEYNVMLKERDFIMNELDKFSTNYLKNYIKINNDMVFTEDYYKSILKKYDIEELKKDPTKLIELNSELKLGKRTVKSLIYGDATRLNRRVNSLKSLEEQKIRLISSMIDKTQSVYSGYSQDFFKKAGKLEQMTSTRFNTSVEFSPKEGSIITDYISNEVKKMSLLDINDKSFTKAKGDFFKALRLVYGNEVVDDLYSNFEIAQKNNELLKFSDDLKYFLEDMSGIVIGDYYDFENAGLKTLLNKSLGTVVDYGLLSRNPHQYQGSLRGTRFVALSNSDKNLSFLSGMFGDKNKMANTQGNLYLVGKRTAIAAHGDHDGDKFQALFIRDSDFWFRGNQESKKIAKRSRYEFEMYQLLSDYKGNFLNNINNNSLSNVERKILNNARYINQMDKNASDIEVYNKIEHIIYSQKIERLRASAEVLDENKSHAEIAFYKLLKDKEKLKSYSNFKDVLNNLDDNTKIRVLAGNINKDDLKDLKKLFDPAMLEDEAFVQKINKVQAIENIRDAAESFLVELGQNYQGKIKWNNTTFAESVYASYTGIARTGTIHYALTNYRDSAITLYANTARKLINANTNSWDNPILKDTVNDVIDSYVSTGRFIIPANSIDELIDKLAISSKLGGSLDPYKAIGLFDALSEEFDKSISSIANLEDSKFYNFDFIKNTAKYLADNESQEFNKRVLNNLGVGSIHDLLSKMFTGVTANTINSSENFLIKMLGVDNFKEFNLGVNTNGITNKALLQQLSNIYTVSGKSVLSLGAGTIIENKNGVNILLSKNPYGGAKTNIFKPSQNFFFGLNAALRGDKSKDGYRSTVRLFDKFKEVLEETKSFIIKPEEMVQSKDKASKTLELNINSTNIETNEIEKEVVESTFVRGSKLEDPKPKLKNIYLKKQFDFDKETVNSYKERIEKLENYSQNSLTNIKSLEKEIETVNQSIAEKVEIIDNTKDNLEFKNKLEQSIKEDNEFKNALERELENEREQAKNLQNNIDSLNNELKNISNKLEESEIELSATIEHKNNLTKDISEIRKAHNEEIKALEKEHKQAINKLNHANEKSKEYLKLSKEALEKEVETLKLKLKTALDELDSLKKENKILNETINVGNKTSYTTFKDTADTIANNSKKFYNSHKKLTIGAGVTAVLGTALHILQKSRPVIDLELDEKDYESSQGSIYRNLGNYNINTNIRSVR